MGNTEYDKSRVSKISSALKNSDRMRDDLQKYAHLMRSKTLHGIGDKGFQDEFFNYYHLNRGNRGDSYKEKYFEIMRSCLESWSFDFETILNKLYKINREADITYAAKLIHTLDPESPIWGSCVEKTITDLWYGRLGVANRLYAEGKYLDSAYVKWIVLQAIYTEMRYTGEYQEYVNAFNVFYPEFKDIPDTKKVDFALWAYGDLQNNSKHSAEKE